QDNIRLGPGLFAHLRNAMAQRFVPAVLAGKSGNPLHGWPIFTQWSTLQRLKSALVSHKADTRRQASKAIAIDGRKCKDEPKQPQFSSGIPRKVADKSAPINKTRSALITQADRRVQYPATKYTPKIISTQGKICANGSAQSGGKIA